MSASSLAASTDSTAVAAANDDCFVLPRDVRPVGNVGGKGPQLVKDGSNLVEDIGQTSGFRCELGCKRVGIEASHSIGVVGELPLGVVEGGPNLVVDEIAILPDQADGRRGQRLLAVSARFIKRRIRAGSTASDVGLASLNELLPFRPQYAGNRQPLKGLGTGFRVTLGSIVPCPNVSAVCGDIERGRCVNGRC